MAVMKNVTVTLDDEVHRQARIRAAELGTSLSALVKDYLVRLVEQGGVPLPSSGVGEMPVPYKAQSAQPAAQPAGPPWLVDGKWVYTRDGKPRQPGALRGKIHMADDWDEWPEGFLESFEAWDYDGPKAPK
ncbi:MAG TPA: hypothetical protein VNT42_02435 [Sphingomonas sp.]|nr:hypothetical protein [Sphingomonas sp.]